MGSVTYVSPQCVSTKPSNEAYRPLQTAVIRSTGYAGDDSCNAAARSTKEQKEQPKLPSHACIASKTPFFFSITLILLCRARMPVTLFRMSVAPATVPVFGSLRLAFLATQTVNGQISTSQKSRTHRESKR